jgi:hypothetical protein
MAKAKLKDPFGTPCPHEKCKAKIVRVVGDLDEDRVLTARCEKGHRVKVDRNTRKLELTPAPEPEAETTGPEAAPTRAVADDAA